MSKGKYQKNGRKSVALMLALVLVVGGVVGGTIAWLTAKTNAVTNTFTTSDIDITLTESDTDSATDGEQHEYKMIPGWTITKDPKVTVETGSEDCYLFVKVEESDNFDDYMTYTIAEGWTELTSGTNYKVYYREVTTSQMGEDKAFTILKDNKVTVKDTVTKEMMSAEDFTQPTLTFTAYAHQLYKTNSTGGETAKFDASAAWNNLNPSQAG